MKAAVKKSGRLRAASKGEQTREAILTHALGLATRVGFEGLTIGRLAEDLEMSKSGLFAHFRSKEALQLEILRMAGARMVETVVKPALTVRRGEPRVRALFERWLAWEQSPSLPGGCPFMAASFERVERPAPLTPGEENRHDRRRIHRDGEKHDRSIFQELPAHAARPRGQPRALGARPVARDAARGASVSHSAARASSGRGDRSARH